MNHLLDVVAHSVVRSAIYRAVWHSPATLVAVAVMLAVGYMMRRY